eukprot:4805043-Lingulodinium_polyedra.AAC.1
MALRCAPRTLSPTGISARTVKTSSTSTCPNANPVHPEPTPASSSTLRGSPRSSSPTSPGTPGPS